MTSCFFKYCRKKPKKKIVFFPALTVLLMFVLSTSINYSLYAQLVLNEVCSANFSGLADEDGDFEDWVEIYNLGNDTINLNNYTLTDKPENPDKWTFPEISIAPKSFLVIFASDKNRENVITNYETRVFATDTFRYINPSSEPDPMWRTPSFTDTTWLIGKGGFGHGLGIYNTYVSDTLMSVFIRKTFSVVDTSEVINAQLHIDYDDAFVAYLNGIEIARSNIRPDGSIPVYNQAALRQHTSQMLIGGLPELFTLNYDELKLILREGENILAIQLHNNWLDDEMSINPFFSLGLNATVPASYQTPEWFFCDSLRVHTNFKLDSKGEHLLLFDPEGTLLDEMILPETPANCSYGRTYDDSIKLCYFDVPHPGNSNDASEKFTGLVSLIPTISPDAGIYELNFNDSLWVELSSPDSCGIIRFSLDGSTPTDTSQTYISRINICGNTVVKARIFKEGLLPGKVATHTYIINKTTNLPMISISTNPENLWDFEEGIYVMGPDATSNFPYYGANFWRDVEIPSFFEYFDSKQQLVFSQDAGLKIHGAWSRAFPQRSLRMSAKSCFGSSEFSYPFFPDKNIGNFDKLVLRNAGNDFQGAHLRDALIHKLIQKSTNLPVQDYQPVVLYLNGEYWGIQNLRERIDKDYLFENFALDDPELDLLENNMQIIEGDNVDFIELLNYIDSHDLSMDEHYQYVSKQLDISNLRDYFIVQLFILNTDWPQNNVKFWKQGNGKWQYIFMDADNSMDFITQLQHYSKNAYERLFENLSIAHTRIFSKLIENNTFRNAFINRYADLLNTTFLPEYSRPFLVSIKDSLVNEMAFHKDRWGGSVDSWLTFQIQGRLLPFLGNRPEYVRKHTLEWFGLDTIHQLHLSCTDAMGSHIRINSIIPESYPWAGIYFDSVPVYLEALPAPGIQFSHWQNSNNEIFTEPGMWWHLSSDDSLTAFFRGQADTLKPILTEINYQSYNNRDAGDWVEIYNPHPIALDLSGWQLKNDNDFDVFEFPENTSIPPSGYLVIVQDSARFANIYPDITPVPGSFEFGLRTWSSDIRLFDAHENLIVSLKYYSIAPWPEQAAGTGRSIELIDKELNMHDPQNWQPGCLGGSPGTEPMECQEDYKICFSEFNYQSHDNVDVGDWVELYNADSLTANLSFWSFKDSGKDHNFTLPYPTLLDPGKFLILCNNITDFRDYYSDTIRALGDFDFGLSRQGDQLRLFEPWESEISRVEYSELAPWPQDISGTGRTAEIIDISANQNDGYNWKNGCLGGSPGKFPGTCHDTANIIITEINYKSAENFDTKDWFEIYNKDSISVNLGGWTMRDSDPSHNFQFPRQTTLSAGKYLVVVQDSLAFKSIHDTIPNFVGEFDFGLSAENDELHLVDLFGQELVNIQYKTSTPWPENPNEPGKTFELINYDASQNDPSNWKLGCLLGSPGMPYFACDDISIEEKDKLNISISVYPNPFGHKLIVEIQADKALEAEIQLKNLHGQILINAYIGNLSGGKQTIKLDTESLKKGIYLLQFSSADFTRSIKLIRF